MDTKVSADSQLSYRNARSIRVVYCSIVEQLGDSFHGSKDQYLPAKDVQVHHVACWTRRGSGQSATRDKSDDS